MQTKLRQFLLTNFCYLAWHTTLVGREVVFVEFCEASFINITLKYNRSYNISLVLAIWMSFFCSLFQKEVLRWQGSSLTLIYEPNKLLVLRSFEALLHGCLIKRTEITSPFTIILTKKILMRKPMCSLLYSWTGLRWKGAFWLAPWVVRIFLYGPLRWTAYVMFG